MALNQTIKDFEEAASRKDFARNNLFRLTSIKCRGLELDMSKNKDEILYCRNTVAIPSRENPHATVKYMGMEHHYPQSTVRYPNSADMQMEFYVDANSTIVEKFERASRYLFNESSSTGNWRFPSMQDVLTVAVEDMSHNEIETITFRGVSFKSIDEVKAEIADGDGSAITFSVHFTYFRYERNGSNHVYTGSN